MPAPHAGTDSLTVSVRTLCEFAARRGDLDHRFASAPSALEGIAGHSELTARRPAGYERELRLEGRFGPLVVRGRADGFDPARGRIEEIKTHRRGSAAQPPPHQLALHQAQARVYGWLLCESRGLHEVEVALVYYDLASRQETVLAERHPAHALKAFFEDLCARFLEWASAQLEHRRARDESLLALRFPHGEFREGQRRLAEAVYRASVAGRSLLAQAPTGIGKTLGSLFPALKAMPGQRLDKLFYLTAKTPGRRLALDALENLGCRGPGGPSLRVLELVAREKACEHPERSCHGESCPLAAGFHDRLPHARRAAASARWLDREALRGLAREHRICPYYLGQEMVRWSDVLVGDYNHFLDRGALLHGLVAQEEWRAVLLVDEAHNLVERARQMYTAELRLSGSKAIRRKAPAALRRPLAALQREWQALAEEHAAQVRREAHEPQARVAQASLVAQARYVVLDAPPAAFCAALARACSALAEWFEEAREAEDAALLSWYFELLRFQDIAGLHGEHSICDLQLGPGDREITVSVRNVVPAPLLKERWKAVHAATLFSATLAPPGHYLEMLGLPEDTAFVDVPSPFREGQLAARIVRSVSTRFRDRQASLDAVGDVMARQYQAQPGNYLAFFSSFDYLQRAVERLAERHPAIPCWVQSRGMSEAQREAFLARFTPDSRGIGFAVLGGAFGEGVDLPGSRLIGAFVATLGLPQTNPVNEQFRQRIDACLGRGYEYTYLYPGLRKVVQAAGRVVRTPEDRGVVYLIDDRYRRSEVRRLLPQCWSFADA